MEYLWYPIAVFLSAIVTYLIAKFKLGDKIGSGAVKVDEVKNALMAFATVFIGAFKPDADGTVTLTAEEVTAIKEAMKNLFALFGIPFPFK